MKSDILIVGAGPVGLMNALGLARNGLDITIIESEASIVYSPRAIAYAWPIIDGLKVWGLYDKMVAAGYLTGERCWRVFKTGETVVLNHDAMIGYTDHPVVLTLGQDKLAEVIYDELKQFPNVKIHWNTRFTDLSQNSDGVTVQAETSSGTVEFSANWVIGADGGKSRVRKSLDIPLEGFTWPERFIATDIEYDFEKYGWKSGYLIDTKYGAIVYKLNMNNLWRVTFAEDASLPVDGVLQRIDDYMQAVLPGDKNYKLVSHSPYNMHQRTASAYRKGRVLLAGDSAHLTNPTSGFGLMGGMFDSFCLSEALGAVAKGEANDDILDRYSELRRKVFINVTSPVSIESMRLTFHSTIPQRLQWDMDLLRERKKDPVAMRALLSISAGLETPSLITGKRFVEIRQEAASAP